MRHRGPDDAGTWSDDEVVIGFRRLSLIDWEHSHQPLPYLDGRYHLIFNGEIYNYLELRSQLTEQFGAVFADQRRRRGDRRRLPLPGREDRRAAAWHVRLPDLGQRGTGAVRCPGLVRHQAALHLHRRARLVLRLGEEGAAVRRAGLGGPAAEHRGAAELPDPAVRSRARLDASADHPDRFRHLLHPAARRAAPDPAVLPPGLPIQAGLGPVRALPRDRRRAARLGGQAHAVGLHGRLVPVRRHRLDRDRGAGQGTQSEPAHLHHRFRAGGLLRDRRRGAVRRGDRGPAHHQGGQPAGDDGHAAVDRLVPRRSGRRPGAGAALLHRPGSSQERQGGAVRRGCGRAVRRLHHLPRTDLAAPVDRGPGSGEAAARHLVAPAARGHARQGFAAPGQHRHRGALLRQRPDLPSGRDAVPAQDVLTERQLHRHHRTALRGHGQASTTRPGCSTSTCSPGCAATSW